MQGVPTRGTGVGQVSAGGISLVVLDDASACITASI
jgi:hypothetical protein